MVKFFTHSAVTTFTASGSVAVHVDIGNPAVVMPRMPPRVVASTPVRENSSNDAPDLEMGTDANKVYLAANSICNKWSAPASVNSRSTAGTGGTSITVS